VNGDLFLLKLFAYQVSIVNQMNSNLGSRVFPEHLLPESKSAEEDGKFAIQQKKLVINKYSNSVSKYNFWFLNEMVFFCFFCIL